MKSQRWDLSCRRHQDAGPSSGAASELAEPGLVIESTDPADGDALSDEEEGSEALQRLMPTRMTWRRKEEAAAVMPVAERAVGAAGAEAGLLLQMLGAGAGSGEESRAYNGSTRRTTSSHPTQPGAADAGVAARPPHMMLARPVRACARKRTVLPIPWMGPSFTAGLGGPSSRLNGERSNGRPGLLTASPTRMPMPTSLRPM